MSDVVDDWLAELSDLPEMQTPEGQQAVRRHLQEGLPYADALRELLQAWKAKHGDVLSPTSSAQADAKQAQELLRAIFVGRIVQFLARAQPGAVRPATLEVARSKADFLKRLGIDLERLNSLVIAASKEGQA